MQVKRSFFILGLHSGDGFGYSPRLAFRRRSSVVERILGKAEVGSSILPGGTMFPQRFQGVGETPTPQNPAYGYASKHLAVGAHPFRVR